jgi:Gas vesicle synthesis protein GvpL/GvpF
MAAAEQMTAERNRASPPAVYVYGVTRSGIGLRRLKGLADASVDLVEHGELAAIVSDAPPGQLRAKRRDVLRHTEVLQRALENETVLPLAFGIVFASRTSVVDDLLVARYEELVELMHRFDALIELTVRAFYREDAVLAEIVREDRAISELREATQTGAVSEAARVRLGEAVAQQLEARRARDADALLARLLPLAGDVVVEERRAEYEVLRASFLVDRHALERFDTRMQELAREQDERMLFKYTGPLAPHSFVSLRGA